MRESELDRMIELAVERLAQSDPQNSRKLVRDLATAWPNEPALSIAFALTSAAASLEDMVDTPKAARSAQLGYKLSALMSADIFALEAMGQNPALGQDLLHFWRRVDPYFLDI